MPDLTGNVFKDNPVLYDALVDWPKRLKNEEPFYRRLLDEVGVRHVFDAACGTGQHAHMFHSWGLKVEGADLSPAMIAHCRAAFGENDRLRWVERSFDQPASPAGQCDAVICVGNSLALAPDHDTVRRALGAMLASLRPGGVCVIQVLNLWRLPEGPTTWQKCKRLTLDGADTIILKGVHRVGSTGFVEFVCLRLDNGTVERQAHTATILGLEADALAAVARQAGATNIQPLGSFARDPYDRAGSTDLILTCRRT